MKFSVLIPVYNVEQYLEECLDSIVGQTFRDFEVVLVDDGSIDKSGEICDRYQTKYPDKIRVIHKENQGLISARRVGIQNAKGDYCVFLDSDDFAETGLLETVELYLSKDADIDILLYSFRYFRDGKQAERFAAAFPDGETWTGDEKKELYEALITTNKVTSLVAKAIKRKLLIDDPIEYEKLYHKNMAEDLLQSLYPLTAAKKICYTERVLMNYRYNTDSISHSYKLERVRKNDTKHVYHAIKSYLPLWGMDDEKTRKQLDAQWFNGTMYQFAKCYENAKNRKERVAILQFDWAGMMPEMATTNNEYLTKQYIGLFNEWKKEEYFCIRLSFIWRTVYRNCKQLKRKIKKALLNLKQMGE